jgi:hypothetical protein
MPGSVYVFNFYNEPISNLSVGGYPAGNVNGCGNGTSAPPYTPASLPVPRAKYPAGSAAFAIGDNSVVIPWDSFRAMVTVTIPNPASSPVSLDDPLILLLAVNEAILLTTRGYVLSTFPVQLANTAMQAALEPDPA